jgi:hypothetical protein
MMQNLSFLYFISIHKLIPRTYHWTKILKNLPKQIYSYRQKVKKKYGCLGKFLTGDELSIQNLGVGF